MPQGKGTYGSQVGRPSKKGKKKYYGGGSVDPFSTRNPEGVAVEQAKEAIATQNEAQQGIPTANAMDRSQKMPDVEQYNKGGKVDVTDVVKAVDKSSFIPRESWEESRQDELDRKVKKLAKKEGYKRHTSDHYRKVRKELKDKSVSEKKKIQNMAKKALKGKKK